MIRVENLAVTFGRGTPLEKHALDGIDLAIDAGEFVSIIGSNGAGKSTLLSAIAGDVSASAGRVIIDGADVTRQSTARRSARVARVFQDPLAGSCGARDSDGRRPHDRPRRRRADRDQPHGRWIDVDLLRRG